jgi:uncharacterized protein YndB with AHSA1/START domain
MTDSRFVYVTYIRTTAERLWEALIEPAFTRQYWFGMVQDCDWKVGSSWKLIFDDGRVADAGEVLECDPPRRMVLKWRHQLRPELHEEGFSRATITLETKGDMVKLTIVHEIDVPQSKLIEAVSTGWPAILSSLKSFLETGTPLARPSTL